MDNLDKDPNRPFSWEEEDRKVEEARKDLENSINGLELLVKVLENGQHKEINDLIIKYASLEGKTTVEFYRFFIAELRAELEFLKRKDKYNTKDPVEKDKVYADAIRFSDFENKYTELCHFDLSILTKIPGITEETHNGIKSALPKE